MAEALDGGATVCLVKDIAQNDLVEALYALARGERSPAVPPRPADGFGLSRQERTSLLHVARGKTNSEIAQAMHLVANTVKSYWQSALAKLSARKRAEAIARAHEARLL